MDLVAVRELYDRTLRADPPHTVGVERTWSGGVLRATQGDDHFIGWWDFSSDRMTQIVAREAARQRATGGDLRWTVCAHDRPEGLERALADAGFEDQGVEHLLVLDASAAATLERPPGVDVRQVVTEQELETYVAVVRRAFGGQDWAAKEFYLPRLRDPTMTLLLAFVGGEPVASGRLEAPKDCPFAGLNDGGVVPEFRGRGLYRALVADRAAEAVRRGARYLVVNAWEMSKPTLERLGFQLLVTRHQWLLNGP
jgi:GNAT superfamily N-acetyltransferase